ncbi:hypothetical protein ACFV0T_34165 [Streptomyces sp. NPDC059582]|uniref:hypothetical protein n=1 Tax=Streptomyces sp. NPDC059582 TaxID=3346875 RepID=UPI00368DE221
MDSRASGGGRVVRRAVALGAAVLAASGVLALAAPGTAQAAAGRPCAGREVRTLPFGTGVVHVDKRAVTGR